MIHLKTQEFKAHGDHLGDQIDNHCSTQPAFCLAQCSYHTHKLNWRPDEKNMYVVINFYAAFVLAFYKVHGF